MKRDEFAEFNTTKKKGHKVIVIIAVIALCLAGILYAGKLRADSSSVFMSNESVKLTEK